MVKPRRSRTRSALVVAVGLLVAAVVTAAALGAGREGQDLLLHPEGHAQSVRGDRRPRRQARPHRARRHAGRLLGNGGHGCGAAAGDPGRDPGACRRHRHRRQRSPGRVPGAPAGPGAGHEGRRLRLGRELPPAVHQPGGHRDDRAEPDQAARQADALQGSVRDPVRGLDGDEPERLDQVHEAGAEEAGLQEHEARQDLLRQRQPGPVPAGDGEHAAGLPEPEGDRVADDCRDLVGRAVPLHLEVQEEGRRSRASACPAR